MKMLLLANRTPADQMLSVLKEMELVHVFVKTISSEIHMNHVDLNVYSMQIVLLIWLVLTQNAKTHVLEVVALIVNVVLLIMLQIVFVCLVILEIHIQIVTLFKKNVRIIFTLLLCFMQTNNPA